MKPISHLLLSTVLFTPALFLAACDDDSDDATSSGSAGTDGTSSTSSGTDSGSAGGTDSGAGTGGTGGSTDATASAGTGGSTGGGSSASASGGTGGGAHAGSCDGLDGGLQCWHAVNEFDTPMTIMEACTNAGGIYSAGDCPKEGLVAICDQTPFKIFHYYEGVDLGLTEIACMQIGGIWMPQ